MKRWKNKTQAEKMETLWFWFRLFLIFGVLNSILGLFQSGVMMYFGL